MRFLHKDQNGKVTFARRDNETYCLDMIGKALTLNNAEVTVVYEDGTSTVFNPRDRIE